MNTESPKPKSKELVLAKEDQRSIEFWNDFNREQKSIVEKKIDDAREKLNHPCDHKNGVCMHNPYLGHGDDLDWDSANIVTYDPEFDEAPPMLDHRPQYVYTKNDLKRAKRKRLGVLFDSAIAFIGTLAFAAAVIIVYTHT
jgi:hypothetical protein